MCFIVDQSNNCDCDTIDREIFISCLENLVGIQGSALKWFRSYLSHRSFGVNVGQTFSSSRPLTCGVLQGPIFGPLLFSLYILPSGSIFCKYGVAFHSYADDTQIYVPLKSNDKNGLDSFMRSLIEVKTWLPSIILHFNKEKTELIWFGDPNPLHLLGLGELSVYQKPVVRNLGVSA